MALKSGQFPNTIERHRITTLKKYESLYQNDQLAVLGIHELIKKHYKELSDLVYLSHSIPARVTDFYGDFVQGDVDQLIIQADTENEKDQKWVEETVFENDLKERMSDFGEDQSQFGFVVFLGWTDEDKVFHIDSVPADQYFPQTDNTVVFASYRLDPDDTNHKKLIVHTQHYQKNDEGKVFIEHQAWYTNDAGVVTDPFPLDRMGDLIGRKLEEKEQLEIEKFPIKQADNGRRTKWGFGKSDYYDIVVQLAEINERTTQASTVFLKNIDAKLVVPASSLDEDEETGETKLKQQEVYVTETKEDMIPQYVTNTNPLLADSREHVNGEMRMIEWITGVPMWALTKSGNQVEKVESLRIQLFSAVRKTEKKRARIKRALLDLFRIGAEMTGQSEDLQKNDIKIVFSSVVPVDEMALVETETLKITSGISSRKSSIMRVENVDEEGADEELERIADETKIAGIGDEQNAPTLE